MNPYDSTWTIRAPDRFFQSIYEHGPIFSVEADANSSGRYAKLLDVIGPASLVDWPVSGWTAFDPSTVTTITPGNFPARFRIECITGSLTLKSMVQP